MHDMFSSTTQIVYQTICSRKESEADPPW